MFHFPAADFDSMTVSDLIWWVDRMIEIRGSGVN